MHLYNTKHTLCAAAAWFVHLLLFQRTAYFPDYSLPQRPLLQ